MPHLQQGEGFQRRSFQGASQADGEGAGSFPGITAEVGIKAIISVARVGRGSSTGRAPGSGGEELGRSAITRPQYRMLRVRVPSPADSRATSPKGAA